MLRLNEAKDSNQHQVYIGLGSNISPEANIPKALELLSKEVSLEAISSVWESPPAGGQGPNFLNAVARVRTSLTPDELRDNVLRAIETHLGRVRTEDPNAPRTIDLDILIYNQVILDPTIWTETYQSVPLSEIYPDLISENGETIEQISMNLARKNPIRQRLDVLNTYEQCV